MAQLVQALVTEARQPELHLSDPREEERGQPTPQIRPLTLHALCGMRIATVTVIRQVKKKEKRSQGRDLAQVKHGCVNGVKWRRTEVGFHWTVVALYTVYKILYMLVFLRSSGNFSSITSISVVLFHLFSSPGTHIIHMSSVGISISTYFLLFIKFWEICFFFPISDFIFIHNLFTGNYKMNFNVFPLPLSS